MWQTLFRVIVWALFLTALTVETQHFITSSETTGTVVDAYSEKDFEGDLTFYYDIRYQSPTTGAAKIHRRFTQALPASLIFLIDQGELSVGESHPLRVPDDSSWIASFKFGYWYSEFSKSLGFGLLAVLSVILRVGESRRGFWRS